MSEGRIIVLIMLAVSWVVLSVALGLDGGDGRSPRDVARLRLACLLGVGPIVALLWLFAKLVREAELPGLSEPGPPTPGDLSFVELDQKDNGGKR